MSYHPPTIFCLPSFPNQSSQQITLPSLTLTVLQESGRLQYFGFSSMDCGIVIRDIGTRDSGGWTCRVSATVAGKHQVSADIVRLFVGNNNHSSKSCLLVNWLITRNIHQVFIGCRVISGGIANLPSTMIWHTACQTWLVLYWHRASYPPLNGDACNGP